MVTHPDSRKGPVDRTPPTGRLTVTHLPERRGALIVPPPSSNNSWTVVEPPARIYSWGFVPGASPYVVGCIGVEDKFWALALPCSLSARARIAKDHYMEWYLGPLKKYAEFSGRASRKEFWLFALFNTLAYLILFSISPAVGLVYALGTWLPAISVTVRRLHDTNRHGGWFWLQLLPLVGIIILFVWMVSRGTEGDNDHGPAPLAATPSGARPLPQALLKSPTEQRSTKVVQQGSMADELKKLSKLKDSEVLTESEFEEQKAKLLEAD
jgi:uncharacterized membrane protein YhaH (DUF805 family)